MSRLHGRRHRQVSSAPAARALPSMTAARTQAGTQAGTQAHRSSFLAVSMCDVFRYRFWL
jgi:hypothetical protein